MIKFICKKKYIDSGLFTINQLKIFTELLIDAVVIVTDTCEIQGGEIDYFGKVKK